MSIHAISRVPEPYNEPVRSYAPGTPEREELRVRLAEMESQQLEIPLVIGGERITTGDTFDAVEPQLADTPAVRLIGDPRHAHRSSV